MTDASEHTGSTAWERFVRGETGGSDVPPAILQSWERCRAAGVDHERPSFHQVPSHELDQRMARSATLLSIAMPHLRWLSSALAPLAHAVYLVDADGIVLDAVGEPAELRARAGLCPGFDWSERRMGTNGAGSALVLRQPVAVVGGQHYCRAWHDTTCVGAPIFGPQNELMGAVDLTTSLSDGHAERLPAVRHIAFTIERELALCHTVAETRAGEAAERSARVEAEAALRSRDELLALVSHHMRTPLARIATSAAVMLDQLSPFGEAAAPVQSQLLHILEAIERMEVLVQNLLDLGRIEAGSAHPAPAPHSLRELLLAAVAEHAPLAQRKGQQLTCQLESDLTLLCDGDLTAQALRNLIENAIKFSPAGAVIEVHGQRAGAFAHICVVDQGPGIGPDDLPRIFERYFQASGRRRHGVGLGLYIARAFLQAQGGAIHADSTPGQGSRFCLELPLVDG